MSRIRMGLVLGLLLAVAACGSGGGNSEGVASLGDADQPTTTRPGGSNAGGEAGYDLPQALAFARCMRQHGINLPDPQVTAEGIDQQLPPGMRRDDPRVIAAERACAQRGGGGK